MVVVIALVVGLAFALGGDDDSSSAQEQTGFAEIIGDPLPPYSSSAADPAVGTQAPIIRAQTFDNETIQIDPADGTPRVIGFFAHWCPHCQRELPRLVSWIDENAVPEGVEVVAISTSVDSGQPNYPPSAWFEDEGWSEVLVRDSADSALAAGYGLAGFPYFVVTDGNGQVLVRTGGELTTEQWEDLVELAEASASV